MLTPVRRIAALVAAPALTLAALAATSSPASAAPTDPAPLAAGTTWLTTQLTDGIVHNDQYDFDDLGLSADVAFGLHAVPGNDATVQAIANAVAPRAKSEWYTSEFGGVTTIYAGSLAKAAALAEAADLDPTTYGGENLITAIEGRLSDADGSRGRLLDENNDFGDANAFGQAYAVQALAGAASSTRLDDATDFLLAQQCSAGWFRLDFADRSASDQTCNGDQTSVPDTDATVVAGLALLPLADEPAVAEKLALTKTWLLSQQRADGSFGGGPTTESSNANSTGLAGWLLGELGETTAAARAATWVRAHQATNVGGCAPYAAADRGTIAYDSPTLTALRTKPVAATTRDQFRRATAQALPVLQWAPAGGTAKVAGPTGFVRAGTSQKVAVSGVAPGEALCVSAGAQRVLVNAGATGAASVTIKLGASTSTTAVTVARTSGSAGRAVIRALAAKRLPVAAKSRVRKGKTIRVVVRGLAGGESVKVAFRGRSKHGRANVKGVYVATLRVTGKAGKAKVHVRGQFANRSGTKTVKVVR